MEYRKEVTLKDGTRCVLRSVTGKDAAEVLRSFLQTHDETDFLASYPDEGKRTVESQVEFCERILADPRACEIGAFLGDKCVGTAGFEGVGERYKYLHRADYGISIEKAYWGKGLGRMLTEASLEMAKKAGYTQMELQVVGENDRAYQLYRTLGFEEYGRNPRGMKSRITGEYQMLVHMRKEL